MKDHSECKRGFHHVSRAWYSGGRVWRQGVVDELTIGFYHPEGGTTGEFCIVWVTLAGTNVVPQLRAYDDAWSALQGFRDFLDLLAKHDGEDLSPEAVIALLKECGVEDMTAYTRSAG